MKDKNPSQKKGNYIVGLGFLLTTFSFTVLIDGNTQIITATIGITIALSGFYLLEKGKKT